MEKGYGCFTWIGLMLATFAVGTTYQTITRQSEDPTYIFYLAIPLAFVAAVINHRIDKRAKQRQAAEEREKEEEANKELESRKWLWRVDREEAIRQKDQREAEENTTVCYACKMRIPKYASICPYCRTRFT